MSKSRIGDEYRHNVENLKMQLEAVQLAKVQFEEENKFLKAKVQDFELEQFADNVDE